MRLKFVLAALLAGACNAAPLIDEPVAELRLKSGKVLTNAVAKSYTPTTVFIRHAGGAASVKYEEFPGEYTAALAAKRPAPPTAAELAEKQNQIATQKALESQRLAAAKEKAKSEEKKFLRNGVRIVRVNFSTPQSATVTLRNETDRPARVFPSSILGRAEDGRTWPGKTTQRGTLDLTSAAIEIPGNATWPVSIWYYDGEKAPSPIIEIFWE